MVLARGTGLLCGVGDNYIVVVSRRDELAGWLVWDFIGSGVSGAAGVARGSWTWLTLPA